MEQEAAKVNFWQADAYNLKPIFTGFDLIFAGNLIDRLYDPKKFLDSLASRLNEKGMLIFNFSIHLAGRVNYQREMDRRI